MVLHNLDNFQEDMNMKKVSLAALVVALTSTAAMAADAPCPKAFQGFHLGGNIGYGVGFGKQKLYIDDLRIYTNDLRIKGVDGGIGTGYLHRFGNWGLGLAFDANWANSKGSFRFIGDFAHKARLKNSLQLYGKTGYVICEKTMPFIALGWDNSQWSQNVRDIESFSKKKRLNGFLWKAGVDFLATRHVVLGIEYTGTTAGKHRFTRTVPHELHTHTYKASFKPQYNKFALTARVVY